MARDNVELPIELTAWIIATGAHGVELVRNPDYAGRKASQLEALCHDRTPFLTVVCACKFVLHLHESQTIGIRSAICSTCKGCGEPIFFPPGFFADAFATLRAEGWIAR